MTMALNQITVQKINTPYGYQEDYIVIDGIPIVRYLSQWVREGKCSQLESFGELEGLYPAWGSHLLWKAESRFIWELIETEETVHAPVLLCEDDLDLSCIVIVARIRKDREFVYWEKFGLMDHSQMDFEKEKQSGILCLEAYSDEDWALYGDDIALERVGSEKWKRWISENWEEEQLRRLRNYIGPYMQKENHIIWIASPDFVFARAEYEACVAYYKKRRMEVE